MYNVCKKLTMALSLASLVFAADYTEAQKRELGQQALEKSLAKLFSEGMKIKTFALPDDCCDPLATSCKKKFLRSVARNAIAGW